MFVVERLGVRYHKVVGVRRVKVAPKNNLPKAIGDTCSHNFICVSSNMTTKHMKQTSIDRTSCETDQMHTEETSGESQFVLTNGIYEKLVLPTFDSFN